MFNPVVYSSGCSCFIPWYTVRGVRVLSGGIQFGVFVFYPVVYSLECSCFIRWYTVWGVRVLSGGIQFGLQQFTSPTAYNMFLYDNGIKS